jgi:hypothetical protein
MSAQSHTPLPPPQEARNIAEITPADTNNFFIFINLN